MSDTNDLANVLQRLESLEIKASFTEDLLDQLNMTIYRQQELIDRLAQEVIQLRRQVPEGGAALARRSLAGPRPQISSQQYLKPMESTSEPSPEQRRIIERLESLEIKASFTEDLLDQLNMTIYRQQELIDRLAQEVIQLRRQVPEGGGAAPRNLRDELPPHY